MKETLVEARWANLAARLGIARPLVAFRWLEAHYEQQARNNIAWGLDQLEFGRATFRWTARF